VKRFSIVALIALAGACTAASLQAQNHEVRANVPFNFVVGSKQLPAGHYTLYSESSNMIMVQNSDQRRIIILSRTEEADPRSGSSSVLVFDKYGDHYFLREIRCPSIALTVEIPSSKLERQIRTQMAWQGPDQTLLALN
jgi:hypothetical protein